MLLYPGHGAQRVGAERLGGRCAPLLSHAGPWGTVRSVVRVPPLSRGRAVLVRREGALVRDMEHARAIGLLLLFDILSWQEAISGFSNPAVVTIGAIFIMSRALVKTGFLEVFADFLAKKGGNQKWLTIFIFLLTYYHLNIQMIGLKFLKK